MDSLEQLRADIMEKVALYCQLRHGAEAEIPFVPDESRIPYAGRVFDAEEVTALTEAALDFWLTWGDRSREFERRLAEFLGVRFALMVNSGSSANLLAFSALTSPTLGEGESKEATKSSQSLPPFLPQSPLSCNTERFPFSSMSAVTAISTVTNWRRHGRRALVRS